MGNLRTLYNRHGVGVKGRNAVFGNFLRILGFRLVEPVSVQNSDQNLLKRVAVCFGDVAYGLVWTKGRVGITVDDEVVAVLIKDDVKPPKIIHLEDLKGYPDVVPDLAGLIHKCPVLDRVGLPEFLGIGGFEGEQLEARFDLLIATLADVDVDALGLEYQPGQLAWVLDKLLDQDVLLVGFHEELELFPELSLVGDHRVFTDTHSAVLLIEFEDERKTECIIERLFKITHELILRRRQFPSLEQCFGQVFVVVD